jgi:phage terminase large subunit-like protein
MESNDLDWTAGSKVGRTPDGRFVVGHHTRGRMSPSDVERLLVNTAQQDGFETEIALPQIPPRRATRRPNI